MNLSLTSHDRSKAAVMYARYITIDVLTKEGGLALTSTAQARSLLVSLAPIVATNCNAEAIRTYIKRTTVFL